MTLLPLLSKIKSQCKHTVHVRCDSNGILVCKHMIAMPNELYFTRSHNETMGQIKITCCAVRCLQ